MGNGCGCKRRVPEETDDIRLRNSERISAPGRQLQHDVSESSEDERTQKSFITTKVKMSMKQDLRNIQSIKHPNQNEISDWLPKEKAFRRMSSYDERDVSTDAIEIEYAERDVEGRANRLRLIINQIISENQTLLSNPSNIRLKWWNKLKELNLYSNTDESMK